jgi:aminoglycoside phosphotransferase (APT) family kinase protein
VELGVPLFDGAHLREDRARHYEAVIRRTFPLLSCEARTHVERIYEGYLNDPECFDFQPVLVHTDLAVNTLIDLQTRRLCGLIDFGDAAVSSPTLDFWLPTCGLKHVGVEEQTAACLEEAGVSPAQLGRMQPELEFLDLRYPLLGILHGLNNEDTAMVEESIQELNAMVPRDVKC